MKTTAARRRRQALPKFWRPKLTEAQKLNAGLVHHDLVHRLVTGTATKADLWDWIETGFTYSRMMELLAEDGLQFTEEATQAMERLRLSYEPICERMRRTGRVGLSGPELNVAREAVAVMDELLELDRHGIADQAARWSIEQMANIRRA